GEAFVRTVDVRAPALPEDPGVRADTRVGGVGARDGEAGVPGVDLDVCFRKVQLAGGQGDLPVPGIGNGVVVTEGMRQAGDLHGLLGLVGGALQLRGGGGSGVVEADLDFDQGRDAVLAQVLELVRRGGGDVEHVIDLHRLALRDGRKFSRLVPAGGGTILGGVG